MPRLTTHIEVAVLLVEDHDEGRDELDVAGVDYPLMAEGDEWTNGRRRK